MGELHVVQMLHSPCAEHQSYQAHDGRRHDGKLTPHLGVEADWREIGKVAQALLDRQFPGKAVLHISNEI